MPWSNPQTRFRPPFSSARAERPPSMFFDLFEGGLQRGRQTTKSSCATASISCATWRRRHRSRPTHMRKFREMAFASSRSRSPRAHVCFRSRILSRTRCQRRFQSMTSRRGLTMSHQTMVRARYGIPQSSSTSCLDAGVPHAGLSGHGCNLDLHDDWPAMPLGTKPHPMSQCRLVG